MQVAKFSTTNNINLTMTDLSAVTQVVDFYLDDARAAERADIISLSKKSDPASMERLRGYVREGMRAFFTITVFPATRD